MFCLQSAKPQWINKWENCAKFASSRTGGALNLWLHYMLTEEFVDWKFCVRSSLSDGDGLPTLKLTFLAIFELFISGYCYCQLFFFVAFMKALSTVPLLYTVLYFCQQSFECRAEFFFSL